MTQSGSNTSRHRIWVLAAGVLAVVGCSTQSKNETDTSPTVSQSVATFELCATVASPAKCVAEILANEIYSKPISAVVKVFEKNPPSFVRCHDVMHALGQVLLERGNDPLELLQGAPQLCLAGFPHGVVEGFGLTASDELFFSTIPKLCLAFSVDSRARTDCAHGIGHAISLRRVGSVVRAANMCTLLATDDQKQCAQAVFMAYTTPGAALSQDIFVQTEKVTEYELPTLCSELADSVEVVCWDNLWMFYPESLTAAVTYPRLKAVCMTAGKFEEMCFRGAGMLLFFRTNALEQPQNADDLTVKMLSLAKECPSGTAEPFCVQGLAYASTLWWGTLGRSFTEYPSPCPTFTGRIRSACVLGEKYLRDAELDPDAAVPGDLAST